MLEGQTELLGHGGMVTRPARLSEPDSSESVEGAGVICDTESLGATEFEELLDWNCLPLDVSIWVGSVTGTESSHSPSSQNRVLSTNRFEIST